MGNRRQKYAKTDDRRLELVQKKDGNKDSTKFLVKTDKFACQLGRIYTLSVLSLEKYVESMLVSYTE